MAFTSKQYQILEALLAIGQAAGLEGIDSSNHKIRELPKNDQEIPTDSLPCVIYCPVGGIRSNALTYENDSNRTYTIEVCLVVGHEGDFATYQKKTQTWHEQLLRAIEKDSDGEFRVSLPGVEGSWSVEIDRAPNFDRSLLNHNYAYLSVVVLVQVIE